MKLTKEDGSLKGWVIAFIWTASFIGLVFAVSSMVNDHRQLADPNSELSKRKAAIEQQREQERKEIADKYYADPRPVLMGACQGTEVKLIELGGHEYVVATAYAGNHSGGSAVSVTHHVGCKACKKEVTSCAQQVK